MSVADEGDAASPTLHEHVYMIAGTDEGGDCHAVFTDSPARAIGHFKRMARNFADVRGNESFELLCPLIAAFDADAERFGP
jgi:hypothetical protein